MIEKPTILVTSIGRTGTEFFAKLFAHIIPNCTSLHEPDIIKFSGVDNRFLYFNEQIQRAGLWNTIVLKAFGKWTIAKLSDSRFIGTLSASDASKHLHTQRSRFVSKMPGSVYVESNLGYYGLLDIIPQVFKDFRTIYFIRDGRDWVKSMMNWGEVYGKRGIRKLFAHKWPTAKDIKDEYTSQWDDSSRFEQLCWAWSRLNEYALNTISENPNARIYKFEDIFFGEDKYQNFDELISFAVSLPGIMNEKLGPTKGWLEQKVHQSSSQFPGWEQWTKDQKQQFEKICGYQMEKLGYKI
jgi:hypothetical protein